MPYAPLTVPFVENQKEHLTNNTNHFKTTIETPNSYKIMCPKLLVGVDKDKKATEIIIRFIDLPDDQFRLGNTKVYHRQYTCVTTEQSFCMTRSHSTTHTHTFTYVAHKANPAESR